MADIAALRELKAKVNAATGPDRELDAQLSVHFGLMSAEHAEYWLEWIAGLGGSCDAPVPPSPLTASMDAAVALVERVLPGWSWEARRSGTGDSGQAMVWNPMTQPGTTQWESFRVTGCASPSLAILSALLAALAAKDGSHEG